jgi:hypothetical protein
MKVLNIQVRSFISSVTSTNTKFANFRLFVRFEVFTAVTVKNVVFCDIKPQFVFHRRHITSTLQSSAG